MDFKTGDIVFENWRIVRKIGAGASGRVYQIEKEKNQIKMDAAVKVIHIPSAPSIVDELSDDGMDERQIGEYLQNMLNSLIDEIRIMINLKGASRLVTCEDYEVIQSDETNWDVLIRMELLTPLSGHLKNHVYSEADVYKLAVQMTEALTFFESRHIIHRDIKPENIFVNSFGEYKLGDFGIARLSGGTSSMSVKGTENYMAPEVFFAGHYDQTVDIYSLGLVLYRLLNRNRFPFYPLEGSYTPLQSQQARMDRLGGRRAIPKPVQASDRFAEIILKMCAYEPGDRYQSAEELLGALRAFAPEAPAFVAPDADKTGPSRRSDADAEDDDRTIPLFRTDVNGKAGRTEEKIQAGKKAPAHEKPVITEKKKFGSGTILTLAAAALLIVLAIISSYYRNRTYTVTVEGGSGSGSYKAGTEVTVKAEEREGYTFASWEVSGVGFVVSGVPDENDLTLADLKNETLSFIMPEGRVIVEAVYEKPIMMYIAPDVGSGDRAPSLAGTEAKADIEKIVFRDSLESAPENAADVSEQGDRSVLCWTENRTMYIAGEGGVRANEYSASLFENYSNLTSFEAVHWDVSDVKDMNRMFRKCSSLESLNFGVFMRGLADSWDVSNVKNMAGMFNGCSSLEELDMRGWDMSGVTDMRYMFYNCSSLQKLDVSDWDVSAVTDMFSMFYGCSSLESLDVSGWDVSAVTDMFAMFYECSSLESLDVSGWDVSNVTNMNIMFYHCSALPESSIPDWYTA